MNTPFFKRSTLLCAVGGFFIACAANLSYACQSAEKTTAGVLKSRQHIVELQATNNGAVYTVKNLAGHVLAEEITADEVLAQFPQLQHIIQGVADEASLHGAELGESNDIFGAKL